MWKKASTQLTEHVYQLTTSISSHFLIVANEGALVDASLGAVNTRLQEEIHTFLPPTTSLKYLLLTHVHFDHFSGIPFLRKRFPELQVVCSPQSAEILSNGAYLESCYERDQTCAQAMSSELSLGFSEWRSLLEINRIVGEGDSLSLGEEVEIKVISCPGHSEDGLAYFIQPDAALAPGEALGIYGGRDRHFAAFSASYMRYLETLEKFADLDIAVIGFPHSGTISGKLAKEYIGYARIAAERFAKEVKERLEQGELIQQIYESILIDWMKEKICPEGPFIVSTGEILREMIAAIAEGR